MIAPYLRNVLSNPKNLHLLETKDRIFSAELWNSSFCCYLNTLSVNWILLSKIYNWIYILYLLVNNTRFKHVFDGIKEKKKGLF